MLSSNKPFDLSIRIVDGDRDVKVDHDEVWLITSG